MRQVYEDKQIESLFVVMSFGLTDRPLKKEGCVGKL
jgi:hypothetical protein